MHITELRLAARDLAAQRAFYTVDLALPLLADAPAAFTVGGGATRLTFEAAPANLAPYHVAFTIPTNKLAAAKAWLAGRAALLARDGADEFASTSWNAQQVYFRDPAGNILEFIARHTLPNAAPGPFGPRDLLAVSEIGLVVDDVPAAVALLTAALDIVPYQAQSATFAPLGDEHGLFIVVQRGRHWFPTDTPADVSPLALTIRGQQNMQYQVPHLPYRITVTAR